MKKDFDVIYSFSTSPVLMSLPGAVLKLVTGKPYVIYVLDIWPACLAAMNIRPDSFFYRFMGKVSKWIYKRADVLLYSSKRFQQYMEDVHRIHMPDEHYMPQFADDVFEEKLPEKPQSKEMHLMFAGNIGKMQNVEVLIRAAALLKDEPIHWDIVGDGASLEECKELAKELQLGEKVTFHGRKPLEEMPRYYAMADAMLVSMRDHISVNDTLPGKVQSYMAAGKPVLGSIGGETAYVVEKAGCGYCAAPDDPQAFAEVVRRFAAVPEMHRELGERGRQYYAAYFTKQYHMDKLEKLLKALSGKE
jgi:glycosyltransferase involved in cell wall biosynthesis